MTAHTYRTSGSLENPVNDLATARNYLHSDDMTQYVDATLADVVHDIRWDLLTEDTWQVTVIAHRELTESESAALSEWISGQNSDGLGEGFEQQAFAEYTSTGYIDDGDEDYSMASFDWQTNDCKLTLVK